MDTDFFSPTRVPAPRHAAIRTGGPAALFLARDLSEQAIRRPAEPVFSRADMAAARQEGFDAGFAAGLADGSRSQLAAEVETLGLIAAALAGTRSDAARIADEAARSLARALAASMSAAMPDLIRRSGLGEAGAMLAHILPGLSGEVHVDVEVPATLADGVSAMLARMAPEHRGPEKAEPEKTGHEKIGRITVTGSASQQAGRVEIRWAAGQASRRPDQLWRTVMECLEAALGEIPPHESPPDKALPDKIGADEKIDAGKRISA